MMSAGTRTGPASSTWVMVFAVIAIVLLAGGYWYLRVETNRIQIEKHEDLAAIGKLKSGQIHQWRQERLIDAGRVAQGPIFSREFHNDPDLRTSRTLLLKRLHTQRALDDYHHSLLFSPDGHILLTTEDPPAPINRATKKIIMAALTSKKPVLSDIFIQPDGVVCIDTAAALRDADGRPLAVVVLRSNVERDLFPLIQSWPTPSRSAEAFIAQVSNDEVVYLSNLRNQPETALSIRIPLTSTHIPAVQAAHGRQGVFEGKDYRDVSVLADLRPIPGSPWFMVTKVDADEFLSEARYRTIVVSIIMGLFILLAAATTAFLYRQRQTGLFRDLYESEHRQREAEQGFRTTLYSIGDAVITTDREGLMREMNPVAEKLTGWSETEAHGRPLLEIFHIVNEETRAKVENPVEIVLREGRVVGLANHTVLIARDGTEYPIADSGAPIRNDDGTVSGVVLVFSDQTAENAARLVRKESERNLRKAQEDVLREMSFIESAMNSLPGIFYAFDKNGHFLRWNENLELISGYSSEEIKAMHSVDFFTGEEKNSVAATIQEVFTKGKANIEANFTVKGGERIPYYFTGLRFISGNKPYVVGMGIDLTKLKQIEEEHQKLQIQFAQAQRMESIGRLAGGVAHDFNNILGVIIGYAELALNSLGPDEPLHANLDEILKAAKRSTDITRQLLAFARKQTITPRVLDLNETLDGMLKMLQRLIGEDIELTLLPKASPCLVKMDPAQVDQILVNLCINARDAISGVGQVTIETANAAFDHAYCADHPGLISGEFVLLVVSDDGAGMDQKTLDNIFEPFFTTKDVDKGTGLGLATVYGIVKQNHGFINVYSEPGKGATIKIYLPSHAGEAVETKASGAAEIRQSHGETVLVVEDAAPNLKLVKKILEGLGYTVLAAGTPGEAMDLAEKYNNTIHLLITDVVMPEMNGRDLSRRLQALYPNLKLLFMSGYTADVIANRGILDKDMHFIQKPFSMKELAAKIRETLN